MPRHSERRFLRQDPVALFDLVADVEHYPEFLPWCVDARIGVVFEDGFDAEMFIGYKMFRESFTTRVHLHRPDKIHIEYVRGPFKRLDSAWAFEPAEGGCMVDFRIDFQFRSRMLEHLMGAFFHEGARTMVSAFERRAYKRYGVSLGSAAPV